MAPTPRRVIVPGPTSYIRETEQPVVSIKDGKTVWTGSPLGDQRAFVDAAIAKQLKRPADGPAYQRAMVRQEPIVNAPDFRAQARGTSRFAEHRFAPRDTSIGLQTPWSIESVYEPTQNVDDCRVLTLQPAETAWCKITSNNITWSSMALGTYRVSVSASAAFSPPASTSDFHNAIMFLSTPASGINAITPYCYQSLFQFPTTAVELWFDFRIERLMTITDAATAVNSVKIVDNTVNVVINNGFPSSVLEILSVRVSVEKLHAPLPEMAFVP